MKKLQNISATLYEPLLLAEIVKQLADERYQNLCTAEINQPGWKTICPSSIEVHVSGNVTHEIEDNSKPIKIPFTSNFLFTCIKENKQCFQLEWCLCLS